MLKYIEDSRGNIKLVPVPGDQLEEQHALMAIIEWQTKVGPEEFSRFLDPRFVESLGSLKAR